MKTKSLEGINEYYAADYDQYWRVAALQARDIAKHVARSDWKEAKGKAKSVIQHAEVGYPKSKSRLSDFANSVT